MTNLYTSFFEAVEPTAASLTHAALKAASAYLDGKPTGSKVKIGRARRDADFWSCPYWPSVPIDTWRSSLMTLALSRYFAQEEASPGPAGSACGRLPDRAREGRAPIRHRDALRTDAAC